MEIDFKSKEFYDLLKQAIREVIKEELSDIKTLSKKTFKVPETFLNPIEIDKIEKFDREKLYDR